MMSRVSQKIIERLCQFLDSLPAEARNKCSLCNETLYHIVKQAKAHTAAPEGTICRAIADRHNETALPNDRVSANALRQRGLQYEGAKKRPDGTHKAYSKGAMIREIIAGCSGNCDDPAGCERRWLRKSFDEVLRDYSIVKTMDEVMAETCAA